MFLTLRHSSGGFLHFATAGVGRTIVRAAFEGEPMRTFRSERAARRWLTLEAQRRRAPPDHISIRNFNTARESRQEG